MLMVIVGWDRQRGDAENQAFLQTWRGGGTTSCPFCSWNISQTVEKTERAQHGNWLRNHPTLLSRPSWPDGDPCSTQSHPNFPALFVETKKLQREL